MATPAPNPVSSSVAALLPNLKDTDADFRFMSLNDLYNILSTANYVVLVHDYNTSARAVEGVITTLDDQNGEVQNLAIKCLGPLVARMHPMILSPLIEKLTLLTVERAVDHSIPMNALRTVITSLPRPVPGVEPSNAVEEAYASISAVLIPRLVGYRVLPTGQNTAQLDLPDPPPGLLELVENKPIDPDAVDIAAEVARCFGPMLKEAEAGALESAVSNALDDPRSSSVVKKRAIVALSALAPYFSDGVLSSFISKLIQSFRDVHLIPEKRRLLMSLTGAMARSIPHKFGPYLRTLAPFILSALSEEELDEQIQEAAEGAENDPEVDEVRESALIALEAFLASCSNEMRFYTNEIIHAALLFLKYDPNVAEDDSDQEMGDAHSGGNADDADDFEIDEDFEEDGDLDDDSDLSWKVRRYAAKVIYTLISTRASGDLLENGTLYDKVAPALLDRFKEREEHVRLEVLATMGCLIRKTGEWKISQDSNAVDDSRGGLVGPSQSRKRRRGGSDANALEMQFFQVSPSADEGSIQSSIPSSGPRASLAKMSRAIVESLTQLLQTKAQPTRQASLVLLRELIAVQPGALSEHLTQITDHIADAIRGSGGASAGVSLSISTAGAGSVTGSSLRMKALHLAAAIADSHQSSLLRSFLEKLLPEVTLALKDRFYKVSSEAIHVLEQFVKVLTPPRTQQPDYYHQPLLENLYDAIAERVIATDGDGEVRQLAIHAMGTLVARTAGPYSMRVLPQTRRFAGMELIADKIRNETTRMAAIRATGEVAIYASLQGDFSSAWVQNVSLELGTQLRKADRSVRAASLATLRRLVVNPAVHAHLQPDTARSLIECLLPLLTADDLHLLGPTLIVLANLIKVDRSKAADKEMVQAICSLTMIHLAGTVFDALLVLVKTIGEQGAGKALMQSLLQDVGVSGDTTVVGKAMGTLLAAGGPKIGVNLDDFVNELQGAKDDKRKCLALSVLGEAALRLGPRSPLAPKIFMAHFKSKSDQVPLAAAVALGRAGAGNLDKYLPAILQALNQAGSPQYLLLHSIKEILQHASDAPTPRTAYPRQLWDQLIQTSQAEDNRAVGAECIGRLTMIDPQSYLSPLQLCLHDKKASIRGMAIQAIRYAVSENDDSHDDLLGSVIITMLTTMLADVNLDNARLALTTMIAATNNKPDLILPHLGQLVPLVMRGAVIKPHLIREVEMGPFKHKVDDGLELRKSAYETLYTLMETAFSRMNTTALFDRVIAGLADEHDIRVLCNLMLTKLITLEPDETQRRLDQIAAKFKATLSFKPKETAVKQEVEKSEEAHKGALRVSIQLDKAFPNAATAAGSGSSSGVTNSNSMAEGVTWKSYWEWVKKDFSAQLKGFAGWNEGQ